MLAAPAIEAEVAKKQTVLLQEERATLKTEVAALRAEQPEAVPEDLVGALVSGLAAHHAGCLPAWKSLIERCFQRGAPLSFVSALLCQETDVHAPGWC